MTQDDIYRTVKAWIDSVGSDCKAIAIRASETGPRPTATKSGSLCAVPESGLYVTMDIASDDIFQECGPRIYPCGDCFVEEQCCLNEIDIDLQAYRCGAFDLLKDLRGSLKLHNLRREYFAEMSIREIGQITPLNQIIKGSKEERAAMTVTFGYVSTVQSPVPCLDLSCCIDCDDPCETH